MSRDSLAPFVFGGPARVPDWLWAGHATAGRLQLILAQSRGAYQRCQPLDAHGDAVLVSLNMSPTRQTISLDLSDAGLHSCNFTTLMASPVPSSTHAAEQTIELPPFAVWVAKAHSVAEGPS